MIGEYKICGLCASRIYEPVFVNFVEGLNEELRKIGWRLFLYNTCSELSEASESDIGESSIFDMINGKTLDALIVMSDRLKNDVVLESIYEKAEQGNIPVLTFNAPAPVEGRVNVRFDDLAGFELVVDHVFKVHKPKTVHFMGGIKGNSFSNERMDVFFRKAREVGLEVDENDVSYGQFWSQPAIDAVKKLVAENRVPEALICANDSMAIACGTALLEAGYRIPEDIIVTGYDGVEDVFFSRPSYTTALCDYKLMGEFMAKLMLEVVDGKACELEYKLSPTLILGESCGCVEESKINASDFVSAKNNLIHRYQNELLISNQISAKIQSCDSIEEVIEQLKNPIFYDMGVILRPECLDETQNPRMPLTINHIDKYCSLLDTDYLDSERVAEITAEEIIPNLDDMLEHGIPIIFNALNFIDIPLGYCVFHFHTYEVTNYFKVSQVVTCLDNGIGGFRSRRYQNHLLSQIEDMYRYDSLTSLYNRRGMMTEYRKRMNQSSGQEKQVNAILTDLDGLKAINDNFGHGMGDVAIRTVADALKASTPKGTICTRFGGDEMMGIYVGACDCLQIRRKMDEYLRDYNRHSALPFEISASVGIYTIKTSSVPDVEELLKQSDGLMYKEKKAKKENKA